MSIGVGILGFAHGHVNSYCTLWQQKPEYEIKVVAGWDHDAGRLETARKAYGLQPCSTAEELLARPDVQAVVISAETSLHAGLVEQAAAAGKMIALQKPLALTLAEADRIVAAVQRTGVPFTLAWQMRVDPQNIQLKQVLHSGELGKLFMVRRRHGLPTHIWAGFSDLWHVKPEYNRDIWADDASHAIDFIYWLLGAPETVTAEIASLLNPAVPNDNGVALYRYADGAIAEVSCSFTCVAASPEAPGLKWFLQKNNDWTLSEIASPASHGARISGLALPLAEFFHGKRPPIATAEEGRTVLRMTLACYIAAREGRRVRIDDEAVGRV